MKMPKEIYFKLKDNKEFYITLINPKYDKGRNLFEATVRFIRDFIETYDDKYIEITMDKE